MDLDLVLDSHSKSIPIMDFL